MHFLQNSSGANLECFQCTVVIACVVKHQHNAARRFQHLWQVQNETNCKFWHFSWAKYFVSSAARLRKSQLSQTLTSVKVNFSRLTESLTCVLPRNAHIQAACCHTLCWHKVNSTSGILTRELLCLFKCWMECSNDSDTRPAKHSYHCGVLQR